MDIWENTSHRGNSKNEGSEERPFLDKIEEKKGG